MVFKLYTNLSCSVVIEPSRYSIHEECDFELKIIADPFCEI